jgi:anti-sigma regulatory factor (Ser/Thr protein kinase)
LPFDLSASRHAREQVRGLDIVADPESPLETLLSELVTNAVLHGAPTVQLRVLALPAAVRVEVDDGSPLLPDRVAAPGPDGGYGLFLVDQLASRWGSIPQPHGKSVWFELDHS